MKYNRIKVAMERQALFDNFKKQQKQKKIENYLKKTYPNGKDIECNLDDNGELYFYGIGFSVENAAKLVNENLSDLECAMIVYDDIVFRNDMVNGDDKGYDFYVNTVDYITEHLEELGKNIEYTDEDIKKAEQHIQSVHNKLKAKAKEIYNDVISKFFSK